MAENHTNWKPDIEQKVVALKNGCMLKEAIVYTVKAIIQCPCCGRYKVDLGFREKGVSYCGGCRNLYREGSEIYWIDTAMVAPIQHQYTDISKELADGLPYYKEEVPDKVMVPEKAPASLENQFLEGNEEMIKVFNQLSPEDQKLYAPRVAEMIELGKKLLK